MALCARVETHFKRGKACSGYFHEKKNIVDDDQEDWILQQSAWLDEHIGFPNKPVPLITPTEHFFLTSAANGA
ncbi:hypothetical protein QW131_26750 [Roseibium salinum]|nr:hypothetical protein [Roseibium salinum]